MKILVSMALLIFFIFIFQRIEKLILLIKQDKPDVLKQYGNPKSAKDAYFMYSFILMEGYKVEGLPKYTVKSASSTKKAIYTFILGGILMMFVMWTS